MSTREEESASTTESGGGTGTDPDAALTLATDAILTWPHRRGQTAYCLARVRGARDPARSSGGVLFAVVISELRDQPRGHYVLDDFAGLANTAFTQLLPPVADPATITWYAHHGQFSTHDPAGPETLTRITLSWNGQRYVQPGLDDQQLLPDADAAAYSTRLHLQPVAQLLAALPWDIPRLRRPTAPTGAAPEQTGSDAVAEPDPSPTHRAPARKRAAATMLITDPDDARVLIVKPTYKPRWELPGGAVDADESPAAAAAREIREELGLVLPVGRLLALDYVPALVQANANRTDGLVTVFDGGHLITLDTVTLPPDELSDAAFVGLDQLPEYLPALQCRRAVASLSARRAGTVAYLEDGRPPPAVSSHRIRRARPGACSGTVAAGVRARSTSPPQQHDRAPTVRARRPHLTPPPTRPNAVPPTGPTERPGARADEGGRTSMITEQKGVDLAQIALAVQDCPLVAGLHPGATGTIVTAHGRLVGLFLHDQTLVVSVIGHGSAPTTEIVTQVRAAVARHAPHLYVTVSVIHRRQPDTSA